MFVLLVPPVAAQRADCECSSGREVSPASGCVATKSCFGFAQKSCCSENSACCNTTIDIADSPCSCGDQCQCGAVDVNQLPNPSIPVNDTTSEQTHLLALAVQTIARIETKCFGNEFRQKESASPVSLTAHEVCALLSRFICWFRWRERSCALSQLYFGTSIVPWSRHFNQLYVA